mgnify:FL=1
MRNRFVFGIGIVALAASLSGCNLTSTTSTTAVNYSYVFSSRLAEGGTAFKSISIPAAGTLKVQYLTGDQSDKILRLGVGTLSGTSCNVAQSVDTAANSADSSPQITMTVPISNICISLKDLGNLTQPSAFTITILLETT